MPLTSIRFTTANHSKLSQMAESEQASLAMIANRAIDELHLVQEFRKEVTGLLEGAYSIQAVLELIGSDVDPLAVVAILKTEMARSESLVAASIRLLTSSEKQNKGEAINENHSRPTN